MAKKKNRAWLWWLLLLIGGSAGGYYYWNSVQHTKQTAQDWTTTTVQRKNIRTSVLATGIVRPKVGAEVKVGSRVSGIVNRLYVNVGDKVQKGALLAELDPLEYKARYNQALASLDNAKSNLNYANLSLSRTTRLSEKKYASQDNVDVAQTEYEIAQAAVKLQEANLEFARIQLDYTRIKAPISGVVASVSTQEGETVAASFTSPTFVTILDLARLEVWAYVDETDIGRVEIGQEVSFTVDTYTDTEFKGKVVAIYPKAEIKDNVVNYITIIEIMDKQGMTLRPEMTTTVNIHLEAREDVLALPNRAVRRENGKRFVHVLRDSLPVKEFVKVGMKDKYFTEVQEGLQEGETVLIGDISKKK